MQLLKDKVSIDKFLPHVQANAIGTENEGMLPEDAARSFIRNSAIKFAEKSGILKERIKVDLQCGLGFYPLEIMDCETIISVEEAKLGEFFDSDCSCSWSWGDVCFTLEDDVLNVEPVPTKDVRQGLELKLIVAPKRDACEVDAVLYNKWHDAIVNGALAEIHLMPNRPWSSVNRADYRRRLFEEDLARAAIRDVLDGHNRPLYVRANPNFKKCRSAQRRW